MNFAPNPLIGNKASRVFKYLLIIPFILFEIFSFKPHCVYFRFSPPAFLYILIIKICRFFSYNYKIVAEFDDWVSEPFGVDCKKILVIGNGTDTNHFKPINKIKAKTELGLNADSLYVGFIGNFAIWQGLNSLLQAIPKVLKSHKDVNFLLVGDGPEMAKIRKAVLDLELEKEKIILTGKVPYQETNLYINAFDIGVAPFIRERNESIGLSPLKIRDYAACGVPIITTRIKGLEIVEEKNIGILVPPDDSNALSDAIIKLIK
ncbi:MAG: glycosyltransferase family 4 protein, partial [candidate division WOR-3 bacterium]